MSLREEIKKAFAGIDMCQNFDDETYYREADDILKLFEKRIDERLDELTTAYIKEDVPPMAEMRRSGVIDGVKLVKELLK